MADPDFENPTVLESGGDAPPSITEPPARIGRYRVERLLGQGGFGLVYLAFDEQLHRHAAIKVPHRALVDSAETVAEYLEEARIVAGLDHPHIVPVFDVGSDDSFPCYIVSKFIDGTDLASLLKQRCQTRQIAASISALVADALHHAHTQGLVHRDVKPSNILIDRAGRPFVVDFGIALREQDAASSASFGGTPGYMSPEQARGEGHRVDGRSDIFSLGIVFYEMLVGRHPFRGNAAADLLNQIATREPRPPRQIDDTVPKELERICLKALAKRSSDRYTTARDLADDLRHYLQQEEQSPNDSPVVANTASPSHSELRTSDPTPIATDPSSQRTHLHVVPKGLRSFDEHDADFFLELLPGPRDRNGLPESIRFWKSRIEETIDEQTFSVGLLYGPSGCGKSSFLKAGLLPRLDQCVTTVYVEANDVDTEARIRNGIHRVWPNLSERDDLVSTFTAIRRSQNVSHDQKLLIVIDQFEQWLHSHSGEEQSELVLALRQCDGVRLQCLALVRDDFWMAATRFMRELEIPLREGHNSAATDLFDVRHARRVLAAFGQAFGSLPNSNLPLNSEQKSFIEQAVDGLAQDGKVTCVRLAIFAEMMKSHPWTLASLKQVGGTAGIGVTFLDEQFSSRSAPPAHRYHETATRSLLKALLPDAGREIRGHLRSYSELQRSAGYEQQRTEFDELLKILDNELRLITPIDPVGIDAQRSSTAFDEVERRSYQLTHDYLVPTIRTWLTRKQLETSRGRAELLLAERAAAWSIKSEKRSLPTWWELLNITVLTSSRRWSPTERAMMRNAGLRFAARTAIVLVLLALGAGAWWEISGRAYGRTLHQRLLDADTANVSAIIPEITANSRWTLPLIQRSREQAIANGNDRQLLSTSLALLPSDPGMVDSLFGDMLLAPPQELIVIRGALRPYRASITDRLWSVLNDTNQTSDAQLRAACALADYEPDSSRWETVADQVVRQLMVENPIYIGDWAAALEPIGDRLLRPLRLLMEDVALSGSELRALANLYDKYMQEEPAALVALEEGVRELPPAEASAAERANLAKRQSNLAVALLAMDRPEAVWPLLRHQFDPTLRSYLIERFALGGINPEVLAQRLIDEEDQSTRRALVLAMGEFEIARLPTALRATLITRLQGYYESPGDPGLRSAAEWTLRQWKVELAPLTANASTVTAGVPAADSWYVNEVGQVFTVIRGPNEFEMGEPNQTERRRIARDFAISTKEVTVGDFLKFNAQQKYDRRGSPTADCPINNVNWYDVAAYCNWLSGQDQIPEDQWCFVSATGSEGSKLTLDLAPDYLNRMGYRLPSEAEWEFACRAGSNTDFSCGQTEELLTEYCWYFENTNQLDASRPVGTRKPNDFGLFDMHGNVNEWCQDSYGLLLDSPLPKVDGATVDSGVYSHCVVRGGSIKYPATGALSYRRLRWAGTLFAPDCGFRIARTLRIEK